MDNHMNNLSIDTDEESGWVTISQDIFGMNTQEITIPPDQIPILIKWLRQSIKDAAQRKIEVKSNG
jgi:hypothetical protein